MKQEQYKSAAQRIYVEWDRALENSDVEGLLQLYTDDVWFESPLVPHLLHQESGICSGKDELRQLIEILAVRKPSLRQYYRTPLLQSDNLIMWEYPRLSPEGEQMDFVEVVQLNDNGLIKSHRVYWGWRGFKVLRDNAYHK